MDTGEILTIIGWPVSCILSILAGGWIIPKLTKKRKLLAWAVVSESELIPEDLHESLSLPVTIQVGGETPTSLSLVTFRIGNAGNEVMSGIEPAINLNKKSKVLYIKPTKDLGEFQKCIEGKPDGSTVRIAFTHINPNADCEFEMLVSDYELGSINVDIASPGVEILRKEASNWTMTSSLLRGVRLSLMGIKYDPTTVVLAEIASEIKSARKSISEKEN